MTWSYFVEGDELWVADSVTGRIAWHGKPDGYPVQTVLPVASSEDCIVLLRYGYGKGQEGGYHPFSNLIRCRPDGSVVWWAELPTNHRDETYTEGPLLR